MPIFRRGFELSKPVRRAMLYVSGLGQHEVRLNGQKVGQAVIEPSWSNYRKTCYYRASDVTALLRQGENAIGVMLGNGMYNVVGGRYIKFKGSFGPPKLICQLEVEHTDGSRTVVASDGSWKWSDGPIRFSCTFGGEDYDAREEQTGWDAARLRRRRLVGGQRHRRPRRTAAQRDRPADPADDRIQTRQGHAGRRRRVGVRPGPELLRLAEASASAGRRAHKSSSRRANCWTIAAG